MAEKQEAVVDKFIARAGEWAKWLESDAPTQAERLQIAEACEGVVAKAKSRHGKLAE